MIPAAALLHIYLDQHNYSLHFCSHQQGDGLHSSTQTGTFLMEQQNAGKPRSTELLQLLPVAYLDHHGNHTQPNSCWTDGNQKLLTLNAEQPEVLMLEIQIKSTEAWEGPLCPLRRCERKPPVLLRSHTDLCYRCSSGESDG
uniref:Uncharacterized protein n=1 Tax=Nothobranchius furzeri TaxID=105023 RepID=A0A1A8V4V0_NOTFU